MCLLYWYKYRIHMFMFTCIIISCLRVTPSGFWCVPILREGLVDVRRGAQQLVWVLHLLPWPPQRLRTFSAGDGDLGTSGVLMLFDPCACEHAPRTRPLPHRAHSHMTCRSGVGSPPGHVHLGGTLGTRCSHPDECGGIAGTSEPNSPDEGNHEVAKY